jgi:AAA family ATP:ADP antiporter
MSQVKPSVETPTGVDRLLRVFAPVQRGEGLIVLLLIHAIFLILCSYYLLKTVREGLVLASGGMFGLRGEELKLYASGAMAVLLIGIVPLYGWVASRVPRIRLIRVSYLAVLTSLGLFFLLGRAGVPVGVPFYLWLGIVNVFLVGQFWSYASDLCTEDQGKRLFAAIGVGGSAGAIAGPRLALLADTWTSMIVAAALIAVCLLLFATVERVARAQRPATREAAAPLAGDGGFALIRRDRYLALIAVMLVVANVVNTLGEFILSGAAVEHAAGAASDAERREMIKAFYASFYSWVNGIGFLVQAFLVSRLLVVTGVRTALFVLPAIALAGYGLIGLAGGLFLIRTAKIVENATDYSLQNTVRQALFLPTSREAKYKAKAAIDTFFVRTGDLIAALVVMLAVGRLGLSPAALAGVNVALAIVWLGVAGLLARRHRLLERGSPS